MSENGMPQNIDLENWMRDLSEQLRNIPIIYLAIPGSHDSMTYGITRSSGLAPDAEPILKRLYPIFQGTILRWTITQAVDTLQQLLIGIRYFDLRLATKTGSDNFFFTHGVYAGEISTPLKQIKDFINTHPHEVVILDFQHFYGFTPDDHQRLMKYVLNLFGPQLVPRQTELDGVTLNSLHRLRQQVVVVYRNRSVYATSEFWQPQMLPSPWPQQDNIRGLLNFLKQVKRHPGMGFVHQAVLTPTPSFIVFRYYIHAWVTNLSIAATSHVELPTMITIVDRLIPNSFEDRCNNKSQPKQKTYCYLFLIKYVSMETVVAVLHNSNGDTIFSLIPKSWISNLRDKCAKPVKNEIYPKLSEFTPGRPLEREGQAPVNVIIADFVEMDDAIFSKTVIQLNFKLTVPDNISHSYG